jgi:signal transduction histidine kinase
VFHFLTNNRDELIARCKAKVARRSGAAASSVQLSNGVPLFLEQLTRTLEAEEAGELGESFRISGASGGDTHALSEMGVSASAHGRALLELGYTVDQVVHDYGDLCQAISDLAVERDAPFGVDEFRTLNRCLDNAIADAVSSFAAQREVDVAGQSSARENQRLGFFVHEFRNHVQVATLAFIALESGKLGMGGSTSGVLKRSLAAMSALLKQSISEVRLGADIPTRDSFSVAAFVADAQVTAALYAGTSGCTLKVPFVDPLLGVVGNRLLLAAALTNLLQNAFKFTHSHTEVTLTARAAGDRVLIEVQDNCGGLPEGTADRLFKPFSQSSKNKSGLGLGLSIARQSVEADGGTLSATDLPGAGCVFTISLPRQPLI